MTDDADDRLTRLLDDIRDRRPGPRWQHALLGGRSVHDLVAEARAMTKSRSVYLPVGEWVYVNHAAVWTGLSVNDYLRRAVGMALVYDGVERDDVPVATKKLIRDRCFP